MLFQDASANKSAYQLEHETRLQDSSNYNYSINRLNESNTQLWEALRLEQAMPKVVVKSNADWWKFALGGTALGGLIYFIFDNFIIKK